ncbi:MAG TPA: TonB-dependent receptor, partial [Sphingobacteriaceae bacterium]
MKRNRISVVAGLGLAQLALLTGNATAQDQSDRSLEEVVVTASRSPRKQSEIGKVVHVITSDQLEKSQGRTLPDVLNTVAGLTIGGNANNPGDIKSVYLRGASAGNTLILIDGIPVNDASNITGEFDISAVAIDQVERVEILKGGSSTLYGSDAVAGVINIITKKGIGKPVISVGGAAGSYGTFKESLGFSGQFGKTSLGVNVSNLDMKGFSTSAPRPDSDAEFEKDAFHQRSVSVNLGQTISQKLTLRGNLQYNNNEAGLDDGAFNDATNYTYDKRSWFLGLGSKVVLGSGVMNINVSQNTVVNKFDNNGSPSEYTGRITNADATVHYPLASFLDLNGGMSFKYNETDQTTPFGALKPDSANNNMTSVFSSFFLKTNGGFRMELGGRLNSHSEYGSNLTYTINPSYLINERFKLFGNLSSAYKVPSLYQLYSQYGNLNLKPESSRTFEGGFDFMLILNKLNLSFAYFDRRIEDVIDFGQSGGRFAYVNQNKQKDKGYEIEVKAAPSKDFSIYAFYAFVDGKLITSSASSFNLLR